MKSVKKNDTILFKRLVGHKFFKFTGIVTGTPAGNNIEVYECESVSCLDKKIITPPGKYKIDYDDILQIL